MMGSQRSLQCTDILIKTHAAKYKQTQCTYQGSVHTWAVYIQCTTWAVYTHCTTWVADTQCTNTGSIYLLVITAY